MAITSKACIRSTPWFGAVYWIHCWLVVWNIFVIFWLSVLLVEETEVPEENNHRLSVSHWQTWSYNALYPVHRSKSRRRPNTSLRGDVVYREKSLRLFMEGHHSRRLIFLHKLVQNLRLWICILIVLYTMEMSLEYTDLLQVTDKL
jgi:hypothetical protein